MLGAALLFWMNDMSDRELIALGTSSQIPTRYRNHNAYFLRWDEECFLFDPGEGTQRQMLYANLAASSLHHICVTHFHGDHCLGLAGMIQRLSLDRCEHVVSVYYPASGQTFFERLRYASIYHDAVNLAPKPIAGKDGLILLRETPKYKLYAHALDHGVPAYGYRLEEQSGRRFLPEKLAEFGIKGPMVGELSRRGSVEVAGKVVQAEEVSVFKSGSIFAFVMDTRACPGTVVLAQDADLLVMEATYTSEDQALATDHGHCSSVDAANTARDANVKQLAITHFSQRYLDTEAHLTEARAIFPNTIALQDLQRITIPRRK
jgi:ribonuclease Z